MQFRIEWATVQLLDFWKRSTPSHSVILAYWDKLKITVTSSGTQCKRLAASHKLDKNLHPSLRSTDVWKHVWDSEDINQGTVSSCVNGGDSN